MNDHPKMAGLSMCVMLALGSPWAAAQDVGDGMAIERASSVIDGEAHRLGGTKAVFEYLQRTFGVPGAVIYALREQRIGYGEISTVLAMAEQMPGGINQDNIDEIIGMRHRRFERDGWVSIAGYLGVDAKQWVSRVNAVAMAMPKGGVR